MSSQKTYKFKAKITLFPGFLGGRTKPVYPGFRPSFSFNSSKHYSGQILHIGKDELKRGESANATILLMRATTIRVLKVNDAFTITEGAKAIGSGIIEKIELPKLPA